MPSNQAHGSLGPPALSRVDFFKKAAAVTLGVVALASAGLLFFWEAFPWLLPDRAHDFLSATSLTLIALAYLCHQSVRRPAPGELVKAGLLAIAFLFWAANQFWPDLPLATLFNDLAIALFVLDVFLVIVGWPRHKGQLAFAETGIEDGEAVEGNRFASGPPTGRVSGAVELGGGDSHEDEQARRWK